MLKTPKKHLPKGYPLASTEESKRFEPIFERAFEIHKTAHDFDANVKKRDKFGNTNEFGPRDGILSPVLGRSKLSKAHYCDCYERAYQELHEKVLGS
jgi:hypothetical protein